MAKFNAGAQEDLEKQAEAIGIYQAVMGGDCDRCSYFAGCAAGKFPRIPDDAACSKRKADILKKWEEGY